MGAVATVLPTFPGVWALPEHSQMRWLSLHIMQRGVAGVADVEAGL